MKTTCYAGGFQNIQEVKYRTTAFITVITRSIIRYGCPPNLAYRLSDKLIQQLDQVTAARATTAFCHHILNEFSLLVREHAVHYSSEVVNKAAEFIFRNLYDGLSNEAIAAYAHVTPAYLSALFKQVTQTSLHRFIIHAKINEAKYLLTDTEIPLKEIAERLHFSNQSYFGKLFKECTGHTPQSFRILF